MSTIILSTQTLLATANTRQTINAMRLGILLESQIYTVRESSLAAGNTLSLPDSTVYLEIYSDQPINVKFTTVNGTLTVPLTAPNGNSFIMSGNFTNISVINPSSTVVANVSAVVG